MVYLRPLEIKTKTLDFIVNNVNSKSPGHNYDLTRTPGVPSQSGVLILDVSAAPGTPKNPINQLIFYGNSAVLSGYLVRATLTDPAPETVGELPGQRDSAEIREAIKLELFDGSRLLRTEMSTTYSNYQKQ